MRGSSRCYLSSDRIPTFISGKTRPVLPLEAFTVALASSKQDSREMLSRKPQCRTDLVLALFVEVVPSKNRPVAFRRQLVEQPPDNRVLLILQQAVEWPGRRIPHIPCVVARRGLTGLRSPC